MKDKAQLLFVPLGGVGEIGMNLALYGYGEGGNIRWIIVDVGVTFAGDDLPGINCILPNIEYAISSGTIEAIVITHAHEDHYGGILSLLPILQDKGIDVPIFCTDFTAGLLDAKKAMLSHRVELSVKTFKAGDKFTAGPFEVETIYVCHSIPEPVSLLLRSDLGNILHTGDWKIDNNPIFGKKIDEEHFKKIGNEGVLALICDSTNAMEDGESISENDVCESLGNFMRQAKGRVFISTFSSHVGRILSVAKAAQKVGRRVVLVGSALCRVVSVAKSLGYFSGLPPFISEDNFNGIEREKIVVLCTGSQGESNAALNRLSRKSHNRARIDSGDMVIFSSKTIPGNERAVIDIQNRLVEMGADIVLDGEHGLTHISGHPYQSELKKMYEWVKPQIGIPVHGEARHLAFHAKLMEQEKIPQVVPILNGELVQLAPQEARVIKKVPTGRLYQDGNFVGSLEESNIYVRQTLADSGQVSVNILLNKKGNFVRTPELSLQGLPNIKTGAKSFYAVLLKEVETAIAELSSKHLGDEQRIMQQVKKAIKSKCKQVWGKKPMVVVFVFVSGAN